ncbi:MAG: hypothetical protein PHI13_15370 [Methylococcales bacterium]|nr:hypothetical protein [Methylococcales bacterium]
MFKRFFNFLREQSLFQKIVAFFAALGVIASAVLTISQLINSFNENRENATPLVIATEDFKGKTTNQGNQGASGDNNKNTWINKKEQTIIHQGDTIKQGDQGSIGNNNTNTWNNNDKAKKPYEGE